jgi:hypothetical protein
MRKTAIIGSSVLLAVSVVGFILSLLLNAFVLDEYDAYGEVPIPGTRSLHLPAGDAIISFHTQVIGSPGGGGLPIPELGVSIDPPAGVPEPEVVEKIGGTTTTNGDSHRPVWVAHITQAGDYTVQAQGKVTAFISPRLAFGHATRLGYLPWAFAGLFVVSLLTLLASVLLWHPKSTTVQSMPIEGPVEL